MYQSKLIHILEHLSKSDLKKIKKFLSATDNKKKNSVLELFNHSIKKYPNFEGPHIDRNKAFSVLFKGEKFNDAQLRYVMTDLTKLLEQYLIYSEAYENESTKLDMLSRAFRSRMITKYEESLDEKIDKSLMKEGLRDETYFFKKFDLEQKRFTRIETSENHTTDKSLEKVLEHLDTAYLIAKLKYSARLFNLKQVMHIEFDKHLFNELLPYIKSNKLKDNPLIALYYHIVMATIEPDEESHYREFKLLLPEVESLLNFEDYSHILIYARNYCARRINARHDSYIPELFDWYEKLLENKLLFDKNGLHQFDYKNIVVLGCKLKKFKWTLEFIEEYKETIRPEHRENAYNYNLALINFHQKNYNKALKQSNLVEFTDPFYHLDVKVLMMKCYYELNEMIPLFSLIDTFKVYLQRNKSVSSANKTLYINFTKFIKKLVRIKLGSKKSLDAILSEMEEAKLVSNKPWLTEKIDELRVSK